MQPVRTADRFPVLTQAEHDFLDAEVRDKCLLDDFELPADYDALVKAASAWAPTPRDTRTASAMVAAIRRHLDALAAILDTLENDRCRFRSHERVAMQEARVRALRTERAQ